MHQPNTVNIIGDSSLGPIVIKIRDRWDRRTEWRDEVLVRDFYSRKQKRPHVFEYPRPRILWLCYAWDIPWCCEIPRPLLSGKKNKIPISYLDEHGFSFPLAIAKHSVEWIDGRFIIDTTAVVERTIHDFSFIVHSGLVNDFWYGRSTRMCLDQSHIGRYITLYHFSFVCDNCYPIMI